jgi:hypothetical protein
MIYVECKPDRALVTTLGIPSSEIQHESHKVRVCKRLEKSTNSKGLVDEDPSSSAQPIYIKKLRLLSDKHDIKLLHDKEARNYIIMLCPQLEGWILKVAQEAGINLEDYELPNTAEELDNVIKIRIGKFINLIQNIKKKKKGRMLKALEGLMKK